MEISRLIFTKETKEQMSKGLSKLQKGKLRWERIKEAEASGKLSLAKNRYEVAALCGFPESEKKNGHCWVTNKIRHHQLQETILGIGSNGRMEYEYHTIADPDYACKGVKKARQREKLTGERIRTVSRPHASTVKISEVLNDTLTIYKVEIVRGGTIIRVELHSYNEVSEFIKTILKGE